MHLAPSITHVLWLWARIDHAADIHTGPSCASVANTALRAVKSAVRGVVGRVADIDYGGS